MKWVKNFLDILYKTMIACGVAGSGLRISGSGYESKPLENPKHPDQSFSSKNLAGSNNYSLYKY